jgi:hypothetical protein
MAEKEYILFCDESEKRGTYYSNFYGGVLVPGSQYKRITERLNRKKAELNLFGEVKWEKVTEQYLAKYQQLIRCFFDEVRAGHLKARMMFTQNAHEAVGLSPEQLDLQYFLLYYQFIKHGFGLAHMDNQGQAVRLRLYFDRFPDTAERVAQFKGHLHALQTIHGFRRPSGAVLRIAEEDIVEVHSHDHALLQCLDVVLGSIAFRLNEKHKALLPGTRRRGKRTVAKERLYKAILAEIRQIKPGFNVGITSGLRHGLLSLWKDAYRHWCFQPRETKYDEGKTKRGQKRKNPASPTSVPDA